MHRNNYNSLRLLFATAVIFSHSFELLGMKDPLERCSASISFGSLGVCGFFLLSGYLTAQSWSNDPHVWAFLKKRALRLYPAFIVASAVSVFIVGPLGASTQHYFSEWSPHRFLSDLIGLRQARTPAVFAGSPVPSVNGAMWTITFELRCYLLLALIGLCTLAGNRWAMLVLAALLNTLAIVRAPQAAAAEGAALFGVSGYMLWFASMYFAGVAFYHFRAAIPMRKALALAALVLFVGALFGPGWLTRAATVTAGLYLLHYAGQLQYPWLKTLRSGDDLSYGLYLYGWPVMQLAAHNVGIRTPLAAFAFVMAVCVPVATISWRLIESKALRLKYAVSGRPKSRATSRLDQNPAPGRSSG